MSMDDQASREEANKDVRLRSAIEDLTDKLCLSIDGKFDFAVKIDSEDEAVRNLQMLVIDLVDSTRHSLSELETKICELEETTYTLSQTNKKLKSEVAERERVEQKLNLREAKLRSILNSAYDPTLTIDSHGLILTVSHSVERILLWSPDELVSQNVSVLISEPHRSLHNQYLAKYHETGETFILGNTRELEAVCKDGSLFRCELTV
jgi:PAS domain S-box-containing protein